MHIILLSGGSGKRLWPLSNDVRSKQFIKMFRGEDDEYESMVSRVYRQIKDVDRDADITVATSKKQVSILTNQLGGKVSICVEPERRDTFPAIVLAAAFLSSEKGVEDDEPVIVCPVDPYVDNSYFEALYELFELTQTGRYKLNLMGVEPTYPSAKYGYIIPKTSEHISDVLDFKEKPDEDTAKEYIVGGALWNCGVFAFRLGYLLDIAHRYIDFENYTDMYGKYAGLDKISFDYAVAEKETSIGCLRYVGAWKDIGSWNTFAEEMSERVIGNAELNDVCENTNVINELNIPILCMGCKNMIIAASSDGILVSDKKQSSYIKPFVDKMDNEAMYAEKSWGSYNVIDVNDESMVIKVKLLPGRRMYYHSHEHRDEVWNVVSGKGTAVIDGVKRNAVPGDIIKMPAGCKHTVIAEEELTIIEVQFGRGISVEDKTKYDMPEL